MVRGRLHLPFGCLPRQERREMASVRILVVDDEEPVLRACARALSEVADAEVIAEQESARAAKMLADETFNLLVTDIRMPGMSGVELLKIAHEHDPELPVILITGYPTVETAVEAIKEGAADYIIKPVLPDDLLATSERVLERERLRHENRILGRHIERTFSFGELVGRSDAMKTVFDTIQRVAETDVDVLIIGETGTGKELVARSIHANSRRKAKRFMPVDCGAIPENLLESELFGHERGAFTGAHARSIGLLEVADGGTFFFDEVVSLPLSVQAKLLRALQERRIRRVGGKQEIAVDVRVVAASNLNPADEIRAQRFREDLYYRINVGRIELPPLRERVEDVPLLINHFLDRFTREMGRPVRKVARQAMEVLTSYSWPGNVRELQNVVKRALVMSRGDVLIVEDLPDEIIAQSRTTSTAQGSGLFFLREQRVAAFERQYLTDLLKTHDGDVSESARDACVPRGTFYRLMKKYEIDPQEFRRRG
jgi:DNA-binding NtrC family response regulator